MKFSKFFHFAMISMTVGFGFMFCTIAELLLGDNLQRWIVFGCLSIVSIIFGLIGFLLDALKEEL